MTFQNRSYAGDSDPILGRFACFAYWWRYSKMCETCTSVHWSDRDRPDEKMSTSGTSGTNLC